jgi:hypothetical protein
VQLTPQELQFGQPLRITASSTTPEFEMKLTYSGATRPASVVRLIEIVASVPAGAAVQQWDVTCGRMRESVREVSSP